MVNAASGFHSKLIPAEVKKLDGAKGISDSDIYEEVDRAADILAAPVRTIYSQADSQYLHELVLKTKVDLSQTIEIAATCLEIIDPKGPSVFGTLGNFSLVIGKAKSRKTFFISLLISAFIKKKLLQNKIQPILRPKIDGILLFDTEQASYHVQAVMRRILATAQLTEAPGLGVHSLRSLDTKTRLSFIEYMIYSTPDLAVVVIDGIRDLVMDINSAEEASMITNKLLKWTEERNIHIITVLHQNKADNNARGHVGTELINKAESVISVAKDTTNPELSIVTPEYFRGQDFQAFAFGVDSIGLPYISEEYYMNLDMGKQKKSSVNPNGILDSFHLERLREVFKAVAEPKYSELYKQIKTAFLPYYPFGFGDNKAKDCLSYYLSKEWIQRIEKENSRYPVYRFNQPV